MSEPGFLEMLEEWDGIGVLVRRDQPSGTWIFVALHDDTLGPATGGCRMKVYDRPEDGLVDALRLAEGMTYKWAAMDFPFGGGKTVLAVPHELVGEERRGLLHRFGELLNSLGGRYGTGADLGTTTEDMQTIAEVSEFVIGVHGRTEGPMDPSPYTALGVFEGIRAALHHRFGSDEVEGRTVLVEAERLSGAGATLLIADLDGARAGRVAERLGATVVPVSAVAGTPCDVYAPCAVGATLDEDSVPRLACAIVAGAANNQLAEPGLARALEERGILYAPDYVINGGGAMAFTSIYLGVEDLAELDRRVRGIGESLRRRRVGAPPSSRRRRTSPVCCSEARSRGHAKRPGASSIVDIPGLRIGARTPT